MRKKILLSVFVIILVPILIFLIWGYTPQPAQPEAIESLQSTSFVKVIQQNDHIAFIPIRMEAKTGLIFYPGGHVAPEAYSPLLKNIAEKGYLITLIRMPLNLAIFGIDFANIYMKKYPQIENWIIAGHSVGGAMAAIYSERNPENIEGLILWASYPAKSTNLKDFPYPVLSIYGSNDGLSSLIEIENSKHLLPDNTLFIEIQGGNHSQFGNYGFQNGDLKANISIEEQQRIILNQTIKFLDQYPQAKVR